MSDIRQTEHHLLPDDHEVWTPGEDEEHRDALSPRLEGMLQHELARVRARRAWESAASEPDKTTVVELCRRIRTILGPPPVDEVPLEHGSRTLPELGWLAQFLREHDLGFSVVRRLVDASRPEATAHAVGSMAPLEALPDGVAPEAEAWPVDESDYLQGLRTRLRLADRPDLLEDSAGQGR